MSLLLLLRQLTSTIVGTPASRTFTVPFLSRIYKAGSTMGNSNIFTKDPDATLDFMIDWNAPDQYGNSYLGTDTISQSTWAVSSGLTSVSTSNTSTTATIWLSGGTAGQTCRATNTIVTAGGRTDDRTLIILVKSQ